MATDTTMRVGAFEVLEPIGAGGMGAVYRVRHIRDGTEAALKVLLSERARQPTYRRDFQREVQALARLNHPGIATIYDYGTLDEREAQGGPEPFVAGSPWMAMEYVDGESLKQAAAGWGWETLRSRILELLDALAHAHAHDVLHRDLKPSNILIPESGETLMVVDFGIAAVLEEQSREGRPESSDRVKGTPKFMAPEQIMGEWREQGPWTDFYAVGCMVWWFICGRPPFVGRTTTEVLQAHLDRQLGEFDPQVSVAEGTEAWLERMVAYDPDERFRRAADAAWTLVELSERATGEQVSGAGSVQEAAAAPTEVIDDHQTLGTLADASEAAPTVRESTPVDGQADGGLGGPGPSSLEVEPPPIPPNWQRTAANRAEPPANAGLELFGLRRLPVVDREQERDRLWSGLREAADREQPTAMLLRGAAGSGKSKLADWLTRRAEELGAATALRADHSRGGGPSEGLAAMLMRHFRVEGLDRQEAVTRLSERLATLGIDRQTALHDARGIVAESSHEEDDRAAGFRRAQDRHVALRRIIGAIARRRPVVLWVDDAPWGRRAAAFVEFLFDEPGGEPCPVFVVMTAREMAMDAYPEVAQRLEAVADSEHGETLPVEKLSREAHREMVGRMLGFSDELIDQLVDRTEGHPLFAIQLVTDWLERGILEEAQAGFVLADEAEPTIPENLQDLWRRRIDRALEGLQKARRPQMRRMLELGATLGRQIEFDEWRAACRKIGLNFSEQFVEDVLARHGLVQVDGDGGRFVHSMLVDSLQQQAREHGRWQKYNRLCAETVSQAYPDDHAEANVRQANFWVAAGDTERALAPLYRAARRHAELGDYEREAELLDARRDLLDAAEVGGDDRRWTENRVRRAWNAMRQGDHREARRMAEDVVDRAERAGWAELEAEARLVVAGVAHYEGDIETSDAQLEDAEELFRQQRNRQRVARALRMQGMNARHDQKLEEAAEAFERARETFERAGDPIGVLRCDEQLLWLHIRQEQLVEADRFGRDLLERAEHHNLLSVQLGTSTALGEAAKYRGRWEEAIEHFRRAERLAKATGHRRNAVLMALNRAMVRAVYGSFERAAGELGDLRDQLEALGMERYMSVVHLASMVCAAGCERRDQWADHLQRARQALEGHEMRFRDQPWLAEIAAQVASERGAREEARKMFELAADLWGELKEPDEQKRARKLAARHET
jgi:serine/threonine protein kinase/tetratricopeptide (TPR) repeat protein